MQKKTKAPQRERGGARKHTYLRLWLEKRSKINYLHGKFPKWLQAFWSATNALVAAAAPA
jgi:hypothetical protein